MGEKEKEAARNCNQTSKSEKGSDSNAASAEQLKDFEIVQSLKPEILEGLKVLVSLDDCHKYRLGLEISVVCCYMQSHLAETEIRASEIVERLKAEMSELLLNFEEEKGKSGEECSMAEERKKVWETKHEHLLGEKQSVEGRLEESRMTNQWFKQEIDRLVENLAFYQLEESEIVSKLGRNIEDTDIEVLTQLRCSPDVDVKRLLQYAQHLHGQNFMIQYAQLLQDENCTSSGPKVETEETKLVAENLIEDLQTVSTQLEKSLTSLTNLSNVHKARNDKLVRDLGSTLPNKTLLLLKKSCLALGCNIDTFDDEPQSGELDFFEQIVLHLDAIEASFKDKEKTLQEMEKRIEISQAEESRSNRFVAIVAVAATTLAAFLSSLRRGGPSP